MEILIKISAENNARVLKLLNMITNEEDDFHGINYHRTIKDIGEISIIEHPYVEFIEVGNLEDIVEAYLES